jgi:hypothetical protein
MARSRDTTATAFDKRAATYNGNSWHVRYADTRRPPIPTW